MTLDDRAADGQPDAHAIALVCLERIVQTIHHLRSMPTPASGTVRRTEFLASDSVLINNCLGRSHKTNTVLRVCNFCGPRQGDRADEQHDQFEHDSILRRMTAEINGPER